MACPLRRPPAITIISHILRALTLGETALPTGHTLTGELLTAAAWTLGILAAFVPLAVRTYRRSS